MLPPPLLAGRDMAFAAARSTLKDDNRLMRSVSSNSCKLVVWAAQCVGEERRQPGRVSHTERGVSHGGNEPGSRRHLDR